MTQHPPLYYGLMGGLTWLLPGAADMPADALYMIIRLFNVILMLPLPILFWYAARQLVGDSPVAAAAAFLPLVLPGLAKAATMINNDNLAVILGAVIVALSLKVMRGDRTLRTAILLSLAAVAGSLTKGTIIIALLTIPIAYIVQAVRARNLPSWKVIVVLLVGAAGASFWWLRNLVKFGTVQPDAWGAVASSGRGPVRTADVPVDMAHYWETIAAVVPYRFWGSLGLYEPVHLPIILIWLLTALALICIPIAVAALPGRRWEMVILAAMPLASLALMGFQAYRHYLSYVYLPGLQGRYAYPSVFGLLFPIAVVVGVILGRHCRWSPVVIAGAGLILSGWSLYIAVGYIWLPRGEQLQPTNWVDAFSKIAGFFPLPGTVTAFITVLLALTIVGGFAMTVWASARDRNPIADNAAAPG